MHLPNTIMKLSFHSYPHSIIWSMKLALFEQNIVTKFSANNGIVLFREFLKVEFKYLNDKDASQKRRRRCMEHQKVNARSHSHCSNLLFYFSLHILFQSLDLHVKNKNKLALIKQGDHPTYSNP